MDGCSCNLCTEGLTNKIADVMGCDCVCHYDGFVGHDGLCCQSPNTLKKELIKNYLTPPLKAQSNSQENKDV